MKIPAPLALAAGPALGTIAVRMLAGTLRVQTEEARWPLSGPRGRP